jgi:prevent-host-death family protein
MTIHDYHLVMKSVRIADLKARLSEHLRWVRRGHEVTVLDRDTPVARLVPVDPATGALSVRSPAASSPAPGALSLPPPLRLPVDAVGLLLEDRRSGR